MAVIHISEAEAAQNFGEVIAKARAGEHVVIHSYGAAFSVTPFREKLNKPRLITDVLADLEARGSKALLSVGFAEAVDDGIRAHENERLTDPWESS
jgi:antitoxin (DNA-binding transcriptional repressor) of toxin-antitoxin stability system